MRHRSEHENWRAALLGEMGLHPRWYRRTGSTSLAAEPPPLQEGDPALSRLQFAPAPKVSALSLALGRDADTGTDIPSVPQSPAARVIPLRPAILGQRPRHESGETTDGGNPRPTPPSERAKTPVVPLVPTNHDIPNLNWEGLEAAIHSCTACGLHAHRHKAVPGIGDRNARWLFVGEGPGREEDIKGEPFVGPAGRLLDAMLAAMGLERGRDVYIANAVKCRPPLNRTPELGEIRACHAFLDRQIALIQPQIIVALGRPAFLALSGQEGSIAHLRQKPLDRQGVPLIVTYHPAYLLRNPADKRKAWEDLCFAQSCLNQHAQTKAPEH
jgi:uracil-DNA glycosylase